MAIKCDFEETLCGYTNDDSKGWKWNRVNASLTDSGILGKKIDQ